MNDAEQIIAEYLEAFKRANPGITPPELVDRKNGWIGMKLRYSYINYRKKDIMANTDRLYKRMLQNDSR